MSINEDFVALWGKVLVRLKEDGRKTIYAEAREVSNGAIFETEVVAYVNYKDSLLFKPQNLAVIEELIKFFLQKEVVFKLQVFDEEGEKIKTLKKMFGDKLEIL